MNSGSGTGPRPLKLASVYIAHPSGYPNTLDTTSFYDFSTFLGACEMFILGRLFIQAKWDKWLLLEVTPRFDSLGSLSLTRCGTSGSHGGTINIGKQR